jgi:hypothetical protein
VLVPRIGALVLLVGLGFGLAQVIQLVYVVAAEGYTSWLPLLGFLVPLGAVAVLSAVLVLRRRPLGARLVPLLVALTVATAAITFLGWPPVGRFLDDYEQAALARGVTVPQYRREQGWDEERYVEQRTSDVRSQGVVGAIFGVVFYAVLVRVRGPRRGAGAPRTA